jgi:hypothetical protein
MAQGAANGANARTNLARADMEGQNFNRIGSSKPFCERINIQTRVCHEEAEAPALPPI